MNSPSALRKPAGRAGILTCIFCFALASTLAGELRVERVPEGGIQPDALTDAAGRVHLIHLTGEPAAADISYQSRERPSAPWSPSLRVNSQPGSAVAIGTVRGPRLALSSSNRVCVVWNGSGRAEPKSAGSTPLLFARLNEAGTAFEPSRNLMGPLRHLDGGAALAANGKGTVLVVWHAAPPASGDSASDSETARGVYLATSSDDGRTFTEPRRIDSPALGVCACCGLEARFQNGQTVVVLYRSAAGGTGRGLVKLASNDGGQTFASERLDEWTLDQCPMTTTRLAPGGRAAVWSTRGTIQFLPLGAAGPEKPVTISGTSRPANHPVVVPGPNGRTLIVWAEGTGWQRGGDVAWQMVNEHGAPLAPAFRAAGLAVWNYPAAVLEADGSWTVFW